MDKKSESQEVEEIVKSTNELLPLYPDIIIRKRGDRFYLAQISPWVVPMLGRSYESLASRDLENLEGELALALLHISEQIIRKRERITDYTVEFAAPSGVEHAVIIFGDLFSYNTEDENPSILFRLHDISATLKKKKQLAIVSRFEGMIGSGPAMRSVFKKISIYGPSEASVVITGETGTGKELVAQAIHNVSKRKKRTFVSVNCSAISESLFESELFGHAKGSFTGASASHKGRFERADGGTLFLDEMGDMPIIAQAKLLRVLETSEVEPVGAEAPIPVNVRVLAATNVELEQAVAGKNFRADLFHRLAVFRIHIPPLRHRTEDIPLLVDHFLDIFTEKYERQPMQFTDDAIQALKEYTWPGNIRELRNVVERMVVESTGSFIGKNALAEWARERLALTGNTILPDSPLQRPQTQQLALPQYTEESKSSGPLTREMIFEAYRQNEGNLTAAARSLGLHKSTLYRQMKRLDITRESLEELGESDE